MINRVINTNEQDNKKQKDLIHIEEISEDSVRFRQLFAGNTPIAPGPEKKVASIEDPYAHAIAYVRDVLTAFREQRSFSLDKGLRIIEWIIDKKNKEDLFLKALHLNYPSSFLVSHMVNVAIYAIKMGTGLDFSKDQQIEIGIAALLHDVGKYKISEEIIYKRKVLNDREFKSLREAPNYGYEVLRSLREPYGYLAKCALQGHERIDGSGYPQGLKGNEINEYARIIGLVDVYEALTHSRPQRGKMHHYTAAKEILQSSLSAFDRNHIKTLINTFSFFPLHSYVKLNSKAIGRVIATHPNRPMRPKIQIIYDFQGKPVSRDRIFVDLAENPLLHITKSVSAEEQDILTAD